MAGDDEITHDDFDDEYSDGYNVTEGEEGDLYYDVKFVGDKENPIPIEHSIAIGSEEEFPVRTESDVSLSSDNYLRVKIDIDLGFLLLASILTFAAVYMGRFAWMLASRLHQ